MKIMDHIVKPGLVTVDSYRGTGKLLITQQHVYALAEDNSAGMTGGMIGGAVGALIGSSIDSIRKRGAEPEFFSDPDLKFLEESTKKYLLKTALLAKLCLSGSTCVRPTFSGFEFIRDGKVSLKWGGLIHKNKVRKFLEANGVSITPKK
jgi:hypothetical protein